MKNQQNGKIGEDQACEYLINKGYQVLERNYWQKFGEIDIIAKAPDRTLVFIEVKLLLIKNGGKDLFSPEDNFTTQKAIKVKRMCEFFAAQRGHEELIDEERGWRLDLIAIEYFEGETNAKKFVIRHYENV
jgi:putative endonuclease